MLDSLGGRAYADELKHVPVSSLLKQIVDDRLNRLGDKAAALLAVAAVVGQVVPLEVWKRVTRLEEETLVAVAERAEAAHLVTATTRGDHIQFTHPVRARTL